LKQVISIFIQQYALLPDGIELPANWTGDGSSSKLDSAVKLNGTSKEYKTVLKNITEGSGISAKGNVFEVSQ